MTAPACPRCHQDLVIRSHRIGAAERLLSILSIYPFRCQLCRHRFHALAWGRRYARRPMERREFERLQTEVPAAVLDSAAATDAVAIDISMNGCTLRTEAPLRVGQPAWIRLEFPKATIEVEAAVVRTAHGGRIGLEFRNLKPEARARLREQVLALLSRRPE